MNNNTSRTTIPEQTQAPAMKPELLVTRSSQDNYLQKVFAPPGATVETSFSKPSAPLVVEAPTTNENSVGLRPTHNWVVIDPREKEEATASGIAFPQTASRKSNEGIVVAKGPGARSFRPDIAEKNILLLAEARELEDDAHKLVEEDHRAGNVNRHPEVSRMLEEAEEIRASLQNVYEHIPIDLEIGDRVLYVRWAGYAVDVDNHKYYLVEEHNVICVAEDVPGEPEKELAFWAEKH